MRVRVTGLAETVDRLEQLQRIDLGEPGRRAAQVIADAARARTPRRSGRLAAATRVTVDGSTATVGNPLPYAGVIHYGWPRRNITADPFLTSAASDSADAWTEAYAAAILDD